ncbi:MAG: hypothetical protein ABIO65_06080 [Nitrospiria bacterium]
MDPTLLLNLDPWYLMLSLVFGMIGFGYFRYGKRRSEPLVMIAGVLLMVFPYLITNLVAVVVVGLLLVAGPLVARRMGW